MCSHHYTETEYLNDTNPLNDSIYEKSEPSTDLSDISHDFRSVDIPGVPQAIKGFDKSDFCELFSIDIKCQS
jgi:hypothetical protein